jgi:hypothetical protein
MDRPERSDADDFRKIALASVGVIIGEIALILLGMVIPHTAFVYTLALAGAFGIGLVVVVATHPRRRIEKNPDQIMPARHRHRR